MRRPHRQRRTQWGVQREHRRSEGRLQVDLRPGQRGPAMLPRRRLRQELRAQEEEAQGRLCQGPPRMGTGRVEEVLAVVGPARERDLAAVRRAQQWAREVLDVPLLALLRPVLQQGG